MSLDELCDRLHRNDPDLTSVNLTLPDYRGRGVRIGQALLQNDTVTVLRIAIEDLVDENEVFRSDDFPMLQYLRTSSVVQEVSLAFEETEETIHHRNDMLRGLALLAIAQNSRISAFECFQRVPVGPMAQLLTRTTSITVLNICPVRSIAHDSLSVQSFAEALKMNRTLQDLLLFASSEDDRLMDAFLLPLAVHQRLELLCLSYRKCKHIPSSLVRLFQARTTKIKILLLRYASFDRPSWNVLCDALKGSLSVSFLRFSSCSMAVPPTSILHLFRENGSFAEVNLDNLVLDDAHDDKLLAYCQRNIHLEDLLSRRFVDEHSPAEIGRLSLLPHLLAAAQQAPRKMPNSILIGLLALPNDAIGKKPTKKRDNIE
jgi:hypothetical protein